MNGLKIARLAALAVSLFVLIWIVLLAINGSAADQQSNDQHSTDSFAWTTEFIAGYERTLDPLPLGQELVLIDNAVALCVYLNNEHTIPQAWDYGVTELGMSSDQTAVVIEGAIRTHCPQYEGALQGSTT